MIRKIEFTLKNITLYFLGVFILGYGAVSGTASGLGAGPWDTVSRNLADAFDVWFSIGSWTIATLLIVIVLVYTKDLVKVGMVVPAMFTALAIMFWNQVVFNEFVSDELLTGIPLLISSLITIPLGLSLIIASQFPAFVFDELTMMLMTVFKTKNLSYIRIGIEVLGITLGAAIGLLGGIGLGAVGPGSILFSLTIGPLIAFYLKLLGVQNEDSTNEV